MKISVVIPTYNSGRTIEKCLRSLRDQTYPPHEIIVVDGGSTDSTVKKVKRFHGVKLLQNDREDTPGSARNRGAEVAVDDIIFFCDSDCIIDKRALEYHSLVFKKRDDIFGVMGSTRNANPRNAISNFFQKQVMASEWLGNIRQDGTIKTRFSCANFTTLKHVFLENKFREDLISCEDVDFFIRLNKKGLKIFYEPRAVVYHHHPITIEHLFKKHMWYGEGHPQLNKIHGKHLRNRYRFFSPARYITFTEDYLKEAVFSDNRLLCNGCVFDSFQKCKISNAQLIKNKTELDIDLLRVVCLAIAAGILKQRTGIDYKSTVRELLKTSNCV